MDENSPKLVFCYWNNTEFLWGFFVNLTISSCFLSIHLLLQSQQVLEVQQPVHEGGLRLPQVSAHGLDELREWGTKEGPGRGGDHHWGGRIAGQQQGGDRGDLYRPIGAGSSHPGSAFVLQGVRHTSTHPLLAEIPAGQGVGRAMAWLTDCHRWTKRWGGEGQNMEDDWNKREEKEKSPKELKSGKHVFVCLLFTCPQQHAHSLT